MTRIAGTHVIVTGGSQGIGLATVRACLQRGARISIVARDHARLANVQALLGPQTATAAGRSARATGEESRRRWRYPDRHG